MKPQRLISLSSIYAIGAALMIGAAFIVAGIPRPLLAQDPPAAAGEQDLARGPIHEAFAQPVVFDAQPGPVVNKGPPKPIPEMPPEQKPEGDDVEWIGGYWSWDTDRNDYIWVSGIWRAEPSGLDWVPGYWSRANEGWQWVSGYWAKAEA